MDTLHAPNPQITFDYPGSRRQIPTEQSVRLRLAEPSLRVRNTNVHAKEDGEDVA